jgi:predicted RND superfamily exporter protein
MAQLGTAFLLVTMTTIGSFVANLTSPLGSLRDFGIVAAVGMTFTFVIFAIYLPAAKVTADRLRGRLPIPEFGTTPIVSEGSRLARGLSGGVSIARTAPVAFLLLVVLTAGVAGAYGSGVDTEFSEEAFFPSETWIDRYDRLLEPFAPSTYTFLDTIDILETEFDESTSGGVTIYIDQPVRRDHSLERIDRIGRDPPASFEQSAPGEAETESILTVIERERAADRTFDRLVERRDRLGTDVPDRDLETVYDAVEASRPTETRRYLSANRESARVDIAVDPDAETPTVVEDAQFIADRTPLSAVATGDRVVQQEVINATLDSAIRSLVVAFLLTTVVLLVSYRLLEGQASYGLVNLVPVLVTVGLLLASMRFLGIPLTPINAPILSISIGLGVDYTVHFVHRFVDEFENRELFAALSATVTSAGGALTGSMVTTVSGIGVLAVALIPLIQEFGILIALGVGYAYLTSLLVTPSVIVVWDRWRTSSG